MKFNITPELSLLIRTLRIQNDIPSKLLAERIGRSPSYLTKVEKGDVKMIRDDVLKDILSNTCEGDEFYPDKFQHVIRVLSQIAAPERIFEQKWLLQMDTFDRPLAMPAEMAADVNSRLKSLGYSTEAFARIMNANKDLYGARDLPVNEIVLVESGDASLFRVRFHIEEDRLNELLEGRALMTNYETCYNVAFTLIKLEKYGDAGHLEPQDAKEVLSAANAYLASHNIYSMTRYGQILASNEFQSRQLLLLDTFETASSDSVNGIVEMFNEVAEIDKFMAAESIDRMKDNMEWDPAFMLNLIGIRFNDLGQLSYSNRKALLDELKEVYDKYLKMPEAEKKLERY